MNFHFIKMSNNAKYMLAGEFKKTINVWDLANKNKLYTINTSFETSSERLAISNNENLFVTCSWKKKSIMLFSIFNGKILWENKMINNVESIRFSKNDEYLYVTTERYFFTLDSMTGKLIYTLKGYIERYDSIFSDDFILLQNKSYNIFTERNEKHIIPFRSFACLDICIGKKFFASSEANGNLRYFSISDGRELWSFEPVKGKHFLRICQNNNESIVFGILRSFDNDEIDRLLLLDSFNGKLVNSFNLNRKFADFSFEKSCKLLVDTNCNLYFLDNFKEKITPITIQSYLTDKELFIHNKI